MRILERFWRAIVATLAVLSFLNLTAHSQAFGASESILWEFTNANRAAGGGSPQAGVIMDKKGNLFGTTFAGGAGSQEGTAFELTPPSTSKGKWTQSVLWSFGNSATDGALPKGLVMDSSGNLYGTTLRGGINGALGGTVFELSPPSTKGGAWTESVLWSFGNDGDGGGPQAGLIIDNSGDLYGTTVGGGTFFSHSSCDNGGSCAGGTVFELRPPSTKGGAWTESVLWSFGNGSDGADPFAGLIMDSSGNLYGTTRGGGTFSTPCIAGGGTNNCLGGTVFELTPPSINGGDWSESVLWSFGNGSDGEGPSAQLIMDSSGNLFGTTPGGGTSGEGTAFQLAPPSTMGEPWNEAVIWNFGSGTDGFEPHCGLAMDTGGDLYGTTREGGINSGNNGGSGFGGTVFELTPPSIDGGNWTESILWSFGGASDGFEPLAGLIIDNSRNLFGTTPGSTTKPNTLGTVFEISTQTALTAGPGKLNFGNVVVPGTSKSKKVKLTNKGKLVAAVIASVTASAPFTIVGGVDTCSGNTIAPKQTCSFSVEYAPTAVGNVTGSVDVIYNGTSPAVALAGKGIKPR